MVGSAARYLDFGLWHELYQAGINGVGHPTFWLAIVQIIFINLILSGDNAVVIAMACRGLPRRQRLGGLVIGAGVAVILRIVFTVVVARLLLLPYLKLAGGLALIYIAARLLVPDAADRNEMEVTAHLWRAVRIVVVADIVMSLDNIIALVAIAQGDIALLAIGLVISIPAVVAGAALIMMLLDRLPILVWVGAALLGWLAGDVMATDPALSSSLTAAFGEKVARQTEWAAAIAGAIFVIVVGGLWRRARLIKMRGDGARE